MLFASNLRIRYNQDQFGARSCSTHFLGDNSFHPHVPLGAPRLPGLRCVAWSARSAEETGCRLSKCGFDKVTEKKPPGRLERQSSGFPGTQGPQ